LKVFSQDLADQIESGKKDLSIGYKADYILKQGVYNGESYDVIQTKLRGNHISLVDEGRSGHEVSVLDKKDKGVFDMNEEKKSEVCDEEEVVLTLPMIAAQIKEMKDYVTSSIGKLMNVEAFESGDMKDEDEEKDSDENEKEYIKSEIKEDEKEDEKEALEELEEKEYMDEDKEEDKKGAMDAVALKKSVFAEISKRDKLSVKLEKHVGVFDSAEMTLDEVACYGVKKLGLSCKKGQESILIDGYLAGRDAGYSAKASVAMDNAIKSSKVDSYLRGGK